MKIMDKKQREFFRGIKMERISNCNQCFNFCPIDKVSCEKGRVLRDSLNIAEKEAKEKDDLDNKASENTK